MNRPPIAKYHQYQGRSNDCAPHTIAMVVNAIRGQELVKADELAKEMNKPRLRLAFVPLVIRRIPNWATFPWGMVDAFREYGVRARWRFGASPADLQKALDEGRVPMPISGELRIPGGWAHVKPLLEINPAGGYKFADPAYRASETWQTKEEFERLWKNYWNLLVETL
jgi:hypothetical protein